MDLDPKHHPVFTIKIVLLPITRSPQSFWSQSSIHRVEISNHDYANRLCIPEPRAWHANNTPSLYSPCITRIFIDYRPWYLTLAVDLATPIDPAISLTTKLVNCRLTIPSDNHKQIIYGRFYAHINYWRFTRSCFRFLIIYYHFHDHWLLISVFPC